MTPALNYLTPGDHGKLPSGEVTQRQQVLIGRLVHEVGEWARAAASNEEALTVPSAVGRLQRATLLRPQARSSAFGLTDPFLRLNSAAAAVDDHHHPAAWLGLQFADEAAA